MQKKIYSLPNVETRLAVCDNGCVHLHIGPASIHIPAEGLRELSSLAQQFLAAMDARSASLSAGDALPPTVEGKLN